jgi:hypothetical protein
MREAMPDVADFIDRFKAQLGEAAVNAAIKAGLEKGRSTDKREREGGFWAVQAPAGVMGDAIWTDPRTAVIGFPWCRWPRVGGWEPAYTRDELERKALEAKRRRGK